MTADFSFDDLDQNDDTFFEEDGLFVSSTS